VVVTYTYDGASTTEHRRLLAEKRSRTESYSQ
jgi:hypothetical protein